MKWLQKLLKVFLTECFLLLKMNPSLWNVHIVGRLTKGDKNIDQENVNALIEEENYEQADVQLIEEDAALNVHPLPNSAPDDIVDADDSLLASSTSHDY